MSSKELENKHKDFVSLYLSYTSKTECPTFFHRWTALTSLAAWIGRDIYFPFGHSNIHANMYVMLVGLAGTKKSTSIKIGAKLLKKAGYKNFAARKTRQEKFLMDLAELSEKGDATSLGNDIMDQNLFGDELDLDSAESYENKKPAEIFAAADEVNNFIGTGNLDFMSILGDLWDYEGVFDYRLKNSKSVFIPNPTISILGGNTFVGFSKLFPPEATEQGFFSRMLFIYAEPKGREFTIPPEPDLDIERALLEKLADIKKQVTGRITIAPSAYTLLDKIYKGWPGMDDVRFDSYENRRIIHLLKLAMLEMACRLDTEMIEEDIIKANTILTFTEQVMPKALGEFGKARNSDVTHKIMAAIDAAVVPITVQAMWKVVHNDLENRNQLAEIIGNLQLAEKIQTVTGGYLPKKKVREEGVHGAVNWNLLTNEERNLI